MKYKINFTARYNDKILKFKNVTVGESTQGFTWAPMAGISSVIRQFVKQVFPDVKFRIRSSSFSGGDSVTIYIQEPVSEEYYKEIKQTMNNFQSGSFNGMIDLYEYEKNRGISVTLNGKTYDFDTKYMSVENRPMFGTPEYEPWVEKERQ